MVDFIARFEQLVRDAILDIEYFSFHEELLVIPRVRVLTAKVKCIVGGLFFLLEFRLLKNATLQAPELLYNFLEKGSKSSVKKISKRIKQT